MKKIGIYNEYIDAKGGGEKVCLALAEALSKKYDVRIVSPKEIDIDGLTEYFNLNLSKVKLDVISRRTLTAKIVDRLLLPGGIKVLIKDYQFYKIVKQNNFDIFVNNTHQSNLPNPAKKGVYMCMFPQKLDGDPADNPVKKVYRLFLRMLYRIFLFKGTKHAIHTYDLITANSKYTQGYINKYWDRESEVLYPVCDSMKNGGGKEKIILNVGRFFGDRDLVHHKRQDFLLETFIKNKLYESGWELHFAGSVEENAKALKYILALQRKAKGYPVHFHFDCPYNELKDLFNKASIYWHATGYGSDPEEFPEKQEHFGITTVEAMSAGCIPVVIDSAGQQETVQHEKNGFLWSNQAELSEFTKKAMSLKDSQRKELQKNGQSVVKKFDRNAFNKKVYSIFSELL